MRRSRMTVAAALTPLLIVVGCTNDPAPDPVVLPSLTTSPGSAAGSDMAPTTLSPSHADTTESDTDRSTLPTHATSPAPTSTTSTSGDEKTTPSTSSTTSYSRTVFVPSSADDVHPSDHSPPENTPPGPANAHTRDGAAAFARWYFRWIVYGYEAQNSTPLSKYGSNCPTCEDAIQQIDESVDLDRTFSGELPAVTSIRLNEYSDNSAEVIVKGASSGYVIKNSDGSTFRHFKGGESYFLIAISWTDGTWKANEVKEIAV